MHKYCISTTIKFEGRIIYITSGQAGEDRPFEKCVMKLVNQNFKNITEDCVTILYIFGYNSLFRCITIVAYNYNDFEFEELFLS